MSSFGLANIKTQNCGYSTLWIRCQKDTKEYQSTKRLSKAAKPQMLHKILKTLSLLALSLHYICLGQLYRRMTFNNCEKNDQALLKVT